jgi:hypothetical protein
LFGFDLFERRGELFLVLRLFALLDRRRVRLDARLHGDRGCGPLLGRQDPHLSLERDEIVVGAVRPFELLELRVQRIAGELLGQIRFGFGLRLDLIDLLRHAVERLERALIAETAHRLLDGPLGLGALLSRDEDVALALGLFDLVVEEAERLLQLVDGGLLLGPLIFQGRGELVVLALSGEGFLGQRLVARAKSHHRAPLPLLRVRDLLVELFGESFLVGDGCGDLLFRLDELIVHVQDDLIEHLLGIFRAADQVVEVALDELRQAAENSHAFLFNLSSEMRLEAASGDLGDEGKLLRQRDVDLVEGGLDLVEVEIFELERAREDDVLVFEAVVRVDELTGVELEQLAKERRFGAVGAAGQIADVHS